MIRICPERDARCPHGMSCPFVLDAHSCATGWNAPPHIAAEITRLRADLAAAQEREQRMREALERIEQWGRAYPLSVFPEPDFGKAREALEAAGLTLDAVSASNMRYVVEGVSEIARAALGEPQ